MSVRRARGHKTTGYCPIKGCSYTSRIPINDMLLNNKNSVHSTMCPTHRTKLESNKQQ